ncbi:MAG: hypothetical protein M0Z77_09420 [Thermoplasmatales archaeon]|jgi:hypothetical protein|nr:hypothetical protein [Candidatus Thermoplasmatota archaeon]MDA8055845.1 hypothetical protein [Thermoplasmatales archaeon]
MPIENNLVSAITTSRKSSGDGSLVIYNLTKGLDFSKPKMVAEALAKVFFENDAVNWFKVKGDHIEFEPKYKVRILLAEEHNKLLSETVDDFLADLKKNEINEKFIHQIKDISTNEEKLQSAVGLAAIGSFFNKPFQRKDDKIEIEDQLFTEMLGVLEVRTPDDTDLIDWENLPI